MSWTRLALIAHRWIGLVAGLFLVVQAASGLTLVFGDELEALLQPHAFRTRPHTGSLGLDRALAQAQARHPDLKINRIEVPDRPDRALVVRLSGGEDRMLTVDPSGARVLADAPRTAFPIQWLYELHTHFLSGENGRWVIGLNGVALTLMGLTGLIAWWPGRGRLGRALKPPQLRGPAFRVVAGLHRFTGAYLSLVLLIVGSTGLTLVYFKEVTKAVASALPTAEGPKPPKGAPPPRFVSLSTALASASDQAPGRPLKSLRFSGPKDRLLRVVFRAEGGHARRIDQVWIDRADGRVLGVQRAADAPSGTRLLSWVLPLHAGEAYGPLARVFSVTAGSALVLFAVSGAWLYLRRAWPRVRPAPAPA